MRTQNPSSVSRKKIMPNKSPPKIKALLYGDIKGLSFPYHHRFVFRMVRILKDFA